MKALEALSFSYLTLVRHPACNAEPNLDDYVREAATLASPRRLPLCRQKAQSPAVSPSMPLSPAANQAATLIAVADEVGAYDDRPFSVEVGGSVFRFAEGELELEQNQG